VGGTYSLNTFDGYVVIHGPSKLKQGDGGQAFSLAMRFRTMAKRFRGPFFFCRVNECKATSFKF
jgi:hypothetical protein